MRKFVVLVLLAGLLLVGNASAQTDVDSKLPEYKPVSGISGNLSSIGSDTLNTMTLWGELGALLPSPRDLAHSDQSG